jgi:uncharacterized protein YjbI with pentapeptide repeats
MQKINLQCCIGRPTFARCDLTGSYFQEASIGDPSHVAAHFIKTNLTNARFGNRNRSARETDLPQGDSLPGLLAGVSFISCVLDNASWGGADLTKADFLPEAEPFELSDTSQRIE